MLFFSAIPVLPIISSVGPLLITKKLFFGLSKWGDKLLLKSKITTFPAVLLSKHYVARYLIHRLWINLKQKFLYTKADLFNFKSTIPLAKLDMVGSRLVPNDLIFSDDILVDIQLVILSNII